MSGSQTGGNKAVASDINVTPLIDVLLVLLIIFLVVMPIMTKLETLEVPRQLNDIETTDLVPLTIKVKASGELAFNDGSSDRDSTILAVDIARTLRQRLDAQVGTTDKVVFVEFEDAVHWEDVVTTMDTIRSISSDPDHDEVKVALKVSGAGQ